MWTRWEPQGHEQGGESRKERTKGPRFRGHLTLCCAPLSCLGCPSAAVHPGWTKELTWLGVAFFYGGLAQVLAGMWEFKKNNTFGATFSLLYGTFWMSLGLFAILAMIDVVGLPCTALQYCIVKARLSSNIYNTALLPKYCAKVRLS